MLCSDIQLTDEATQAIAEYYSQLRGEPSTDEDSLPITVRTLETIIRLSIAVGKCRLSTGVLTTMTSQCASLLPAEPRLVEMDRIRGKIKWACLPGANVMQLYCQCFTDQRCCSMARQVRGWQEAHA